MTELRVEMHGELLGHLVSERGSTFDFVASKDAVKTHGLGSHILSLAVPLVPLANRRNRRLRQNFFTELLPEGDARIRLAQEAGVQQDDTVGMLRAYGRDLAGALQIWDPTDPEEPRNPSIEPLDDEGVEQMLRDVAISPLGNKPRGGKTSLNGVQSKIVLARTEARWARVLDGYPSTHIVKPIVRKHPSMIFDEEYGSRFARGLGLADFETEIMRFNDTFALVITRYDRSPEAVDGRVHQEDFSQVLGLSGEGKYEMYGHKGLRDAAKTMSSIDQGTLLKMTALSVAVGNFDMHAKNISLLHLRDGSVRLAPMYDVVPQSHLDNDGEMAFRVGGEFEHRLITRAHLIAEAQSWNVRGVDEIVDSTLVKVQEIASEERPHVAAHPALRHNVLRFAGNLIRGRAAGDSGDGTFNPEPSGRLAPGGGWTWANGAPPTTGNA